MTVEKTRMSLRLPAEIVDAIRRATQDPLRPGRSLVGALSSWVETACWERIRRESGRLSSREREMQHLISIAIDELTLIRDEERKVNPDVLTTLKKGLHA